MPGAGRHPRRQHARRRLAGQSPSPGDRGQLPSRVRPKLPLQVREPGRPEYSPRYAGDFAVCSRNRRPADSCPARRSGRRGGVTTLTGEKKLLMLADAADRSRLAVAAWQARLLDANRQPPQVGRAGRCRGDQPGHADPGEAAELLARLARPPRPASRRRQSRAKSPARATICRWRSGRTPPASTPGQAGSRLARNPERQRARGR